MKGWTCEATRLDLLREHAPRGYERIDQAAFGPIGPLDLLRGASTLTVRRGLARSLGDRPHDR